LKSPSSGGKVARKKRTSKARIHFVPSEKDKTQEKATGRKPRKPAAKKRRL
jgi:hypothetical protein